MRPFERFPNLVSMFFARAAERADRPFLVRKIEGEWRSTSWTEAARQVSALAASLRALGLERGDRVMLVSENRPEWCVTDFGIMAAGLVTVPTYITNTERDHTHILENSDARAVIVSTGKLARTLLPAVVRAPECQDIIGIEDFRVGQGGEARFHRWADLVAGNADVAATRAWADANLAREDLACLIYTSGTGGAPRGVRQHHGAILHNVAGCVDVIRQDLGASDDEGVLSFLPTSHAYEHTGGQMVPIGLGGSITYAESLEKLATNMEEVRPTLMFVVPRLFDVLRARTLKAFAKEGAFKQHLLRRALQIGAKRAAAQDRGGGVPWWDRPMDLLLERTLRPRVRARFGGRLKAMVSGGAPLNPEVGDFFTALGITILQGYGQTEAGPIISCNQPHAGIRMDTVGPPMPNTEVRIAEDGEILVRGELVMHGYWRADAETRQVLRDGWLHTGDIGEIDAAGRIKITDRKKDLIVNDKGDNVAPQRVEGMLTLQPEILQAMVVGDRRPHLVGLVVPDPEWTIDWCRAERIPMDAALRDNPAYLRALSAAVDRVSGQLSIIERVRRIALADEPFTVENGELTPSMKIKRHVIRERYGARLDALYGR